MPHRYKPSKALLKSDGQAGTRRANLEDLPRRPPPLPNANTAANDPVRRTIVVGKRNRIS
jgi:hypothetical protein